MFNACADGLRPGPWLAALLAAGLGLAVAVALAALEAPLAIGLVLVLGVTALVVWTGEPRRVLVTAIFVFTPMDISKGLIPPLEQFYSPGLYLSPASVAVLLLLAVWLLQRLLVERRGPPVTRLDALVFLFLSVIWISAFNSPQGTLALATAAAYTLAVLGYYVVSHAVRDKTDLRLAVTASAVMLLLEGVHVALQFTTGSLLRLPGAKSNFDISQLLFSAGGGLFLRPIGFQGHPNVLGHHMVVLLPPALALALLGRRFLGSKAFFTALAVLAVSMVVLLLTLSRGGWASGTLGALVVITVFVRRGVLNRRQLAGFALAAATMLGALVAAYPQAVLRLTSSDNRSVEARVLLTDQALSMIRAHPLIGVGYGNYNRASFAYAGPLFATVSADMQKNLRTLVVHNGYLLLAAEVGLPMMLLFMYLMWRFVRLTWTLPGWRDPGSFALAVGLSGSLVGQMLYWSSDNYYVESRVFMTWLTAGLLSALVRLSREEAAA